MDLEHVAATQAMNTWMKSGGSTQGAWLKRIRAWHSGNGGDMRDEQVWQMEGNEWTPQTWEATKGKTQHLQREVWRRNIWYQFTEGKRHDAMESRGHAEDGYDENVCKTARALYGSELIGAPGRKIMEGAATSELITAKWRKENLDGISCHWCGQDEPPDWEHLAWKCSHFSMNRPKRPLTVSQRRMGWPTATTCRCSTTCQRSGSPCSGITLMTCKPAVPGDGNEASGLPAVFLAKETTGQVSSFGRASGRR